MFTHDFDAAKWAAIHTTHTKEHVHPTGVCLVKRNSYIRTFRVNDDKAMALHEKHKHLTEKVLAMLKIWLYRFAKHGHIAVSDSIEMTMDGQTGHLFIFYDAYDVPPEWSCIISSKVVGEMLARREADDGLNEALTMLGGILEQREAKHPKRDKSALN